MRKPDNAQQPLTKRQTETLARHKRHHSKMHISVMKQLMRKGVSFTDAHNAAMKRVGM